MFDRVKFLKASALLKSFKGNLPKGDKIELNHVDDYHSYLSQLEEQVKLDLTEFRIPKGALKSEEVLTGLLHAGAGGMQAVTETKWHCDPDVFRRQLDATLIFIETYMQDLEANLKATRQDAPTLRT